MSIPVDFNQIKFNYKIWLSDHTDNGIMGDGKWKILKAIEEHGSLKAATEAMGITYRRTWGDLKKIENDLGITLLEKNRGGKEGGNTQLTAHGKMLVKAFDEFHEKVDTVIEDAFNDFRAILEKLN